MKNIYILLFGLLIMSSCIPEQPQNHLTLSGKLENTQDSFLTISNRQGIIKEININSGGVFKDTLKVEEGAIYTMEASNNRAPIYLKNGYNISLVGDCSKFHEKFKIFWQRF